MKLQVASCRLQVFENSPLRPFATFNRCAAFTMVEVAISLAIIGIALVAIIGVLPLGLHTQRDNREATIINQDATIFIEAISKGVRDDDLTNYVYQVGVGSYYYSNFTSGEQIIGLLTTPGMTNHAYVRSISGPAVEKPPQDNPIIRGGQNEPGDSFAYRIVCENIPVQLAGNSTYGRQLAANLHELRLTFLWPTLPNGNLPASRTSATFRTLVAGQVVQDTNNGSLYFFQPQSFAVAP